MSVLPALLVMAMASAQPAVAQSVAPRDARPAKGRFDPATVVTATGTVLGEQRVEHGKGTKSVRLVVKVGNEQVSVHLGPDTGLDRQSVHFSRGEEVVVTGSRFTYDGGTGLIAQSVTHGGDTPVIRDARGRPPWIGHAANQ